MLDDGILEAGVDPALGDGRVGRLRLIEELDSQGVFRQAGCGDGYGGDEADRVGEDAAFPVDDLLGGVRSLSVPWLVTGTLVEAFMLWVSITEAVGSGLRSFFTRASPVRS